MVQKTNIKISSLEASNMLYLTRNKIALANIPYEFRLDMNKLARNIPNMIGELSQLEVYARRTGPRSRWAIARNKKQNEIVQAIDYLEKLLVTAILLA